ncbi:hypothetical protein [Leptothoe spongobia]|uniref:Uncharacterized protein n=1 Tax=Leptothoe spongobia TAU-MAC 1115 TaxID=1967444 RepID=A0A947DIZ1_9CYAN|nr:hypothetical protein [Leptothoe spongobia]MBT9317295.1 hypothetical protein [Leptothoe spongobia TAU-MAC 1115]
MMAERKQRGTAGDKTICLPIADDIDYDQLVEDRDAYREYLNEQIASHPELFPEGIDAGYQFHGWVMSTRPQLKTRRIYLPNEKTAYQRRPDFVTPYMSETSELAGKAMYLRKHGISYDWIAYVLGRSEMHWYRLCQALGRGSIVGTTLKTEASLPPI